MSLQFTYLHANAHRAGMAALNAAAPHPMVVQSNATRQQWFVPDGVCGFAWIEFRGNTAWGRWAKKSGVASKHYPKGLSIWVSEGGQSMERKEAYARAYADVLRAAGIEAYAGSRMD